MLHLRSPLESSRLAEPPKYQGKVVPTVVSLTTIGALLYVEDIIHIQSRRKNFWKFLCSRQGCSFAICKERTVAFCGNIGNLIHEHLQRQHD